MANVIENKERCKRPSIYHIHPRPRLALITS